jgi:hypothetical protein
MSLNIVETIYLDFVPGKVPVVCHASQYDVGRKYKVYLLNSGSPYSLNGNESITLRLRKHDTTAFTAIITNPGEGADYVEFFTIQQMTASAGKSTCEIRLQEGNTIVASANFIMDVEEDPLDHGVTSSSAIYDLSQQVESLVEEYGGGGMNRFGDYIKILRTEA